MGKREIIWSAKAERKLFEILEFYSNKNKSRTYSIKLYQKIRTEINRLRVHPEIGIKTTLSSIRGLIIKDYVVFYEFNSKQIIIHTLWDNRQDPDKLKIL